MPKSKIKTLNDICFNLLQIKFGNLKFLGLEFH